MKLLLTLFLATFCISSCDDNLEKAVHESVSENLVNAEVETIQKSSQKTVIDRVTDENVKQRLLSYGEKNPETIVLFITDQGMIKVRLFEDTPLHRANFIMMAKNGCYDNTVFTRVAREFMAQGGGTYEEENVELRNSIGKFTIPAEISKAHYHKKGALAAARRYQNNPKKRSDPYAFYFVEGSLYNDLTLDKYEKENNYTYSEAQREYYKQKPGAAHIDGQHTVFGEIIEGYDVIPKLTHVKTDGRDWPVTDIYIQKVEVIE